MNSTYRMALVAGLALAIGFVACKRAEQPAPPPAAPPVVEAPKPAAPPAPAPFQVTGVEVGNAVGADKKVTAPSAMLAPGDTFYASIATTGTAPSVTLTARWSHIDSDQVIQEDTLTIAPNGPANSEFHVSKPDGWPAGRYKVEILANGAPAGVKEFSVQ
jgi:hypothetical protein